MIKRFGDGRDWFFEKRFGIFIHWGIYAIPGWHEQHQYRKGLARSEYEKLMNKFNPIHFNPDEWLDLAEEAGMEYVCFTTKHIDGFCMWNTAQSEYNIMNTPYAKDTLEMLAEACHKRNFPLSLYYSCVDMHHPNYPNAGRRYELAEPAPGDQPDLQKYIEYVKAQVRELCTNYGKIHGFWWDGNIMKHRDPSVNEIIRELQPGIIINPRGYDDGDFRTSEREWDTENLQDKLQFTRVIEACNSVGTQSWGYRKEEDYYSLRHLLESMDTTFSKGGNYLLNVGPDALGQITEKPSDILRNVGAWYANVKEAFEGCEPASQLSKNRSVYLTQKNSTLYVHLTQFPISEAVILNPIQTLPKRAVLLNTGNPVEACVDFIPSLWESGQKFLRIRNLPVDDFSNQVMIVRLDFDEPLQINRTDEAAEFKEIH